MDDQSLARRLADYAAGPAVPLHMPGHKRQALHTPDLPWAMDITEIDGFDDLHHPEGILADAMAAAARLWGSEEARFLVNGSTGGILAALHAACPRGSTLLVARNCHKSVYHALELLDITPVYLQPPTDPATGLCGSLPPALVEEALARHPSAVGLFLTSPTYDGVLSDLPALAKLCHDRDIPLLVDEAHGAHLGLSPFPAGAVAAGADVAVHSLHKTLPSLTQTGILHRQGTLIDPQKLARSLNMFQTSSPSYPLMASIDGCVRLLASEEGREQMDRWWRQTSKFNGHTDYLQHLSVLCHGRDTLSSHPVFWGFDPSKIVISTRKIDMTGPQLMERLRKVYEVEMEMAGPDTVTAMTGYGTDFLHLLMLYFGLCRTDEKALPRAAVDFPPLPPVPERRLSAGAALERPAECLPYAEAEGRLAGEYLWAYPPGIPLCVPGEVLSAPLLARLGELEGFGISLIATGGSPGGHIRVCLGENP